MCSLIGPHIDFLGLLVENKGQVDNVRIALQAFIRLFVILIERVSAVVLVVLPVIPGKDAADDGHNQGQDKGNQPGTHGESLCEAFEDDAGVRDCEHAHKGGGGRESSLQPACDEVARNPDGGQDANGGEDAQDPVPAQAEHQQRYQSANQSQNVTQCHILFHVEILLYVVF